MLFSRIVDDDLTLLLIHESLAEEIYALVDGNRDYLGRWLPWVGTTQSTADTSAFIQSALKEYASGTTMTCVMQFRGQICGVISVFAISHLLQKAEIGYWLGAGFQGNGIVTRACQHLIDYVFDDLQLQKVELRAAVDNRPSRGVAERLGMTQEGIIRHGAVNGSQPTSVVIYGLLKSERIDYV